MHFISERIIQAVCWTLLHSLWQGLLVALATGLVMVLSKKSTAAVRYNLLSCLFMVFIAFVAGTFYLEMGKPDGQLLYGNLPVVQTAAGNFTTGATAAGHVWSLNLENFAR